MNQAKTETVRRGIQEMPGEFTLPSETHIGSVNLRISNLNNSLRFYVDLLGLHQLRTGGPAVLSSRSSGSPLIFLTENKSALPKPARTTGLFHVAIRLPDRVSLARLLQRLIDNSFPLQGFANHGVSEAVYLRDPDGNGLELYVDLPYEQWKWEGDQIAMTSDPLDVQGLLDAARNDSASWNGIHPDTDIGHVHLQVRDLARSEEFYHGVLGFAITQRSYPGALFLAAGNYHHHIGLNIWAGRDAQPPPNDAVGLISYEVILPRPSDIQTVRERLKERSIPFPATGPKDQGIILIDPDGNSISLSSGNV